MANYYRRRDLPACYLHILSSYFFQKGRSCCCYGGPSGPSDLLLTGSITVSRFNGPNPKYMRRIWASPGPVLPRKLGSFEVLYKVSQIIMLWYVMKLLTRLFPRNGMGSKYQRSILEDLRPFQRGSFEIWMLLFRNLLVGCSILWGTSMCKMENWR